jgi:hypothetical protein
MNEEVKEFKAAIMRKIDDSMTLAKADIESVKSVKARGLESDSSKIIAELSGIYSGLISAKCAIVECYCDDLEKQYENKVVQILHKEIQDSACSSNIISDTLKRTAGQPTVKKNDGREVNIVLIDESGSQKEYKQFTDDQGRIVIEIKEPD